MTPSGGITWRAWRIKSSKCECISGSPTPLRIRVSSAPSAGNKAAKFFADKSPSGCPRLPVCLTHMAQFRLQRAVVSTKSFVGSCRRAGESSCVKVDAESNGMNTTFRVTGNHETQGARCEEEKRSRLNSLGQGLERKPALHFTKANKNRGSRSFPITKRELSRWLLSSVPGKPPAREQFSDISYLIRSCAKRVRGQKGRVP